MRGCATASCRRSASPTSARRSASGTRSAASRCTRRSSGRTAARRTAARQLRAAGHEAARARAHRAGDRSLLLGDEDPVAARARGGPARARGGRTRGVRHDRFVAAVQADRASTLTDVTNASRTMLWTSPPAPGTPSCSSCFGVPAASVAASARAPGSSGRPAAGAARPRGPASPASPATSRRRCSDRAASIRGWARTPTGPARSCCCQHRLSPARAPARAAGDRRLRRSAGRSRTRWRRRSSRPERRCSGCATGLASSLAPQETEALAAALQGNDGVYFVPALTGLGSPHWDPDARGTIVGLTRGAGRAQLARATLEAIAYQTVDAVRAIEAAGEQRAGRAARRRRRDHQRLADAVPGGRARRARVLGRRSPRRPALGAALLAGIGVDLWTVSDVRGAWRERTRYEPR